MRVCASFTWLTMCHEARQFPSIRTALDYFRAHADADYESPFGDRPTVDLYPDEHADGMVCDSHATYHDYPMSRYEIGPRGGIRRVIV